MLLQTARLLSANHWLSHARQKCLAAISDCPDASDEAQGLLVDIDRRIADPEALNLSLDHSPIAVSLRTGTIISTLHFRRQDRDLLQREAFRQAVNYIDVETSSQCNRRCSYCPNAEHDRLSSNNFMDDTVFIPFVSNLRAIDYAHDVHFVGFNEPLMHRDNILSRLALTRRLLPRANITIYTNGDYLTTDYLDQLVVAGMTEMIVSVHLAPDKPYSEAETIERMNRLAARLALPIVPVSYRKDVFLVAHILHPAVRITIRQLDYMRYGSNRASASEHVGPQIESRHSACWLPINQFVLRYKGAVDPCCTIFSDTPGTAKYSVGNLAAASSIFDIYCGDALVSWRRSLFHLGPKQAPCNKCADNCGQAELNDASIHDPWRHFVSLSPIDPAVLA